MKYDLPNSERLFWQPADVGLPVWSWAIPVSPETTDLARTTLASPLVLLYFTFFLVLTHPRPHPSFYSSLLFSFKPTSTASFSMGQFVQRPPIWLSPGRCHSCLFCNYFRQYFTTFVCQTGVNGDQFSANWAEKRYFRIFQTQSVEGCSWCSWCMQRCIETVWIFHDAAFPQIRKRRFPKVTVLSQRKTFPKFWVTQR